MSLFHDDNKSQMHNNLVIATLVVSSLSLILGVVSFLRPSAYDALVQMESLKAWGMDNRESMQKIYTSDAFKNKQREWIAWALQQMGQQWAQVPTDPQQQQANTSMTLSADEVKNILAGTYIDGNKDADIMIIEYTDPECPYCIRHHNDGTVAKTMQAYPNMVWHIVKVVQWVNHPNTQSKSLAIICAGKLGGAEDYVALYDKILGSSTLESAVGMDKIAWFVADLGISQSKFDSCLADADTLATYQANRQEAQKMGQTGTPGNIVLNVKTGKYVALAGAYPAADFITAIKQLQ